MRMMSWGLSHDCTWINNPCTKLAQIRLHSVRKQIKYDVGVFTEGCSYLKYFCTVFQVYCKKLIGSGQFIM